VQRRTWVAVVWVVARARDRLGAAGIVAGLDHLPGGEGRPELTWAADRTVATDLDAASADLETLAEAVGTLGTDGRAALAALGGRDTAGLDAAIDAGTAQLDVIDAAAAGLRARLAAIPLDGPARTTGFSATTLARYDALVAAPTAVAPLRPAWIQLAAGVAPPPAHRSSPGPRRDCRPGHQARRGGRLSDRDPDHRHGLDRARRGPHDPGSPGRRGGRRDARRVDRPQRGLRQGAARPLGRTPAVGRPVTDAVRTAAAAERTAKEQLPADARALVVIVGDVARGGLNQAVITIEGARAELLDALARAAAPAPPLSGG